MFPKGEWISWNNPALKYRGGTTATVKAPLSEMPLFVRAGSFIPQYDRQIENTSQYDPTFLTVKYFPSKETTSYTLFDDDRKSPTSIADHAYQLITFTGNMDSRELKLDIKAEGSYQGMPQGRMITLQVENVVRKPKNVTMGDIRMDEAVSEKAIRQYGWSYDARTRCLSIRIAYDYKPVAINVKF